MIENALDRHGVPMGRKGRPIATDPAHGPTLDAARSWFADAARPERALVIDEQTFARTLPDGQVVYRDRRCQACGTRTRYETECPRCGEPLDWTREHERDREARELREESCRHPTND